MAAPERKNKKGFLGTTKEKLLAAALVGTIATGGIVIYEASKDNGNVAPSPIPSGTIFESASPSTKPTAEITLAPTLTPEPTPIPIDVGYSQNPDGSINYVNETGEVLNVPQIPGLKAELQDTKVVYIALAENPYGLSENQYAGAYRPNVTMEQSDKTEAQTGGVVLKAPVVNKLIKDKLASIPNLENKWTVVLPIDITNMNDTSTINISNIHEVGFFPITGVSVRFEGQLPAVNIIPGATELVFLKDEVTNGFDYLDITDRIDFEHIVPGEAMLYTIVQGNFPDITERTELKSKFGDRVTTVDSFANIFISGAFEAEDVNTSRILYIDNTPIFVASN